MLVVLDPGFFREDGILSPDCSRRDAALGRLLQRVTEANLLLARPGTRLVVAAGDVDWFGDIYRQEARPLVDAADRALKAGLDRMREHSRRNGRTIPAVALHGQMWGIAMMAAWAGFGRDWLAPLERVVAASVVAAAKDGQSVVFLCHRIVGRNVRDCSSQGVELMEVLRWRLSASIRGARPTALACVGRVRHLDVPWTRRIDDRLPDGQGPGLHPYCPPNAWMNSRTPVWGTQQSRPCWLDAQGQAWARPSTGGGYHWDVYLNSEHESRIGLSQINVTQHGAPAAEGSAGAIHHVPEGKRGAYRGSAGWRCPA